MESECYSLRDLKRLCLKSTGKNSFSRKCQGNLVERTFQLLNSGETEIKLHEHYKNVILILGDTGSGKSKFAKMISGDNAKLISVETGEGTDEYTIENIDDTSRSIITSDTIFPQLMFNAETNTVFSDNPGWNDSRNESLEVTANFFIHKVVRHAERIKMIFTINYPSVSKGIERHDFMKLAKHVADFVKNIDKFRNSILLLVTKVDNRYVSVNDGNEFVLIDNYKIINGIADFLAEVKHTLEKELLDGSSNERQLHEFAIKFISILLVKDGEGQYTRIGIFRRPDEPGPVSEISLMQDEIRHIKRLIHEKLLFSEKINEDFGYTVSEKCKNKINNFVQEINSTVKSRICRVNEEIKDHYAKIVKVVLNTVKSIGDETTLSENFQEVAELATRLRDGYRRILDLIKELMFVTNPEDFVKKITAVGNLNVKISKDDLMEIEKMGRYFNFLQTVSDKPLSILQWDELFKELVAYLSMVNTTLQENIDVVLSTIYKRMESDFQNTANVFQDQFDDKMKLMDMEESLEVLAYYHDAVLKMSKSLEQTMSTTEVLTIVCDVARDIDISLPACNVLNTIQHEKQLSFLNAISEKKSIVGSSAWRHSFESLVNHLDESKIFYEYLNDLYLALSEYETQKDTAKYNVVHIDDWGKTSKPQGIVVTKKNFQQFLRNTSPYNIAGYGNVKNISLTELRLDELNQLLHLTLKQKACIQYDQSSIFIRADYISLKEILHRSSDNGRNFLTTLKSGVFQFLHIFALRKVFIDEDLSFPGGGLCIISPEWEVIGTRMLSLDGAEGEPHIDGKAADGVSAGSNGENGEPGLPGKPGGTFLGIGASFTNAAHLTVTVNGGKGGPGQHGGNGRDGEPGNGVGHLTNDDLPIIDAGGVTRIKGFPCEKISCGNSTFENVLKLAGAFFAQNPIFNFVSSQFTGNTLYKIVGSPGQAGGRGGLGGIGGKGGNPGNVHFINFSKDSRITERENKYEGGSDGESGDGGKPGVNGHIKFGLLSNVPDPTVGLPVPIPGLQVPIPGLPVPIPGLQVPIPGKPAPIPDQPAPIPGQPAPIPGQPEPTPGQPAPIPGLPPLAARIPLLNVPIPSITRRREWLRQFEVPGEVSSVVSVTSGLNTSGLKAPEPSNAIFEPLKIVHSYKMYAEQNLKTRFKKKLVLDFITLLNDDDEMKCLYSMST